MVESDCVYFKTVNKRLKKKWWGRNLKKNCIIISIPSELNEKFVKIRQDTKVRMKGFRTYLHHNYAHSYTRAHTCICVCVFASVLFLYFLFTYSHQQMSQ